MIALHLVGVLVLGPVPPVLPPEPGTGGPPSSLEEEAPAPPPAAPPPEPEPVRSADRHASSASAGAVGPGPASSPSPDARPAPADPPDAPAATGAISEGARHATEPAPPSTSEKTTVAVPTGRLAPLTPEELARDRAVLDGTLPRAPAPEAPAPSADPPVVRRSALPALPPLRTSARRFTPERSAVFVLGYRVFDVHDRLERRQTWHSVSVEAGLLRRYVRLGLLTEVGVEGGEAARGDRNDLMVVQKVGLGAQYPHFVTPFFEVQGGVGLLRTELFERNDLGWVATVGVEAGAQWAVARFFRLHLAVGWLRPYLRDGAGVRHEDTATFRVGVGF